MLGRIYDLGRALVAAAIILVAGYLSTPPVAVVNATAQVASAQAEAGGPMGADPITAEQVLRQGGLLAVVLIILFFYRRDYRDLAQFWREQHVITTKLVTDSVKAQTEMTAALQANTNVMHQSKGVLQRATSIIEVHDHRERSGG